MYSSLLRLALLATVTLCKFTAAPANSSSNTVINLYVRPIDEIGNYAQQKAKYRMTCKAGKECDTRKRTFDSTWRFITKRNQELKAANMSFRLSLNDKCDRTYEELKKRAGAKVPILTRGKRSEGRHVARGALPSFVNWTAQGYVTNIIDQLYCGSCWAIAAVEGVEGGHKRSKGTLVQLSSQNAMDCASVNACNGGWMTDAFDYVINNTNYYSGINKEVNYSYQGINAACRFINTPSAIGSTQSGYTLLDYSDAAVQEAVATLGPIVTAIDSSDPNFLYYGTGIYSSTVCDEAYINHAVLIVGYDVRNASYPYWIVKNSWGTLWGEYGYIRMMMSENICGISAYAYSVTV